MTVVVIAMLILVVAMLCGTKIAIEARRERRRERREEERMKTSANLPRGSRLTAIDPDEVYVRGDRSADRRLDSARTGET